ncbi:MAG: hypothetical protein KGR26_09220, partial [Cyanobacteria bacterium REEB65]|nr:hypothetical protein [Cyanobacteria bacterium REEB65]
PGMVAYWKGPELTLAPGGRVEFAAIDVGHYGTGSSPEAGARVNLPGTFSWKPYPHATHYGFEVLDGTGRDAKVMFRPVDRFAASITSIVYDGGVNTHGVPHSDGLDYQGKPDHFLLPGRYAWSVVWSTRDGGEGHGPAQAFAVVELEPRIFPKVMDPPGEATGSD